MSIKEKAEQYAREKLGDWGSVVHSAYETNECTNSEISVQDFTAGYKEAIAQPKHIFDGAAVAGEVRRFEGELVDVTTGSCTDYMLGIHRIMYRMPDELYARHICGKVIELKEYTICGNSTIKE